MEHYRYNNRARMAFSLPPAVFKVKTGVCEIRNRFNPRFDG
jgi:hypothetical protein